jgi:hypothetical protein
LLVTGDPGLRVNHWSDSTQMACRVVINAVDCIIWNKKMALFSWFRDFVGIRKDAVETKKAKLEIKRLEDEQRERESIKRADNEDVKKYDPKTRELLRKIELKVKTKRISTHTSMYYNEPMSSKFSIWLLIIILVIVFLLIYLIWKAI